MIESTSDDRPSCMGGGNFTPEVPGERPQAEKKGMESGVETSLGNRKENGRLPRD
jgi:hypothetical protein